MYINGIENGVCGLILFGLTLFFTGTKFSDFLHENFKNRSRFIISGLFLGFTFQILVGIPGIISGSQTIILNLKGINSTIMYMLAYGFCFCSLATFEEFLFRGCILKRFMNKFSPFVSIVLASLLFSLLHFFNYLYTDDLYINLINAFIIGVFLSISFIKDGSLSRCISFHISYNLFEVLLHTDNNYKFNRLLYFKVYNNNLLFMKDDYIMFSVIIIATIILLIKSKNLKQWKLTSK